MVNQTLLDYLKKYSSRYKTEDLRRKILSSGYSEKDFNEALQALRNEEHASDEQNNYSKSGKWLKISGICGIIILALSILSSLIALIISQSSEILTIILTASFFISAVSLIFFFYGFIVLGKKYGKKLISVTSWILIVFGILGIILSVFMIISPSFVGTLILKPVLDSLASGESLITLLITAFGVFLIIGLLVFLAYFVLGILFSIGLITLRNEVQYAKISGILNIIGLCTLILGIGLLILLVSFVFEIVLLFKESKK